MIIYYILYMCLNDLVRGKIDKFSLDALVNMLAHAGMRVEMKVKKAA